MVFDGMAEAIAQGQDGNPILLVVILGEPDLAVEDGEQVLIGDGFGGGLRAMALKAKGVALCAEEVFDLAAMGGVASGAGLLEGRLVVDGLLSQIFDVGMAAGADGDSIGLRQAGLRGGVWAVAVRAVAGGAGMRELGGLDLLALFVVAGEAEGLGVGLSKDDLSVLGGRVTHLAAAGLKWGVLELAHQLGLGRLVRVMALEAVDGGEGLILMGLLEAFVLGVVALDAQRGSGLGEVELVFLRGLGPCLVGDMAGFASHVENGMAASVLRNVDADVVAVKAEVLFGPAGGGLEEDVLVVGGVGVMAVQAVALSRRVYLALNVGGLFVCVAGDAERDRSGGNELDACDVLVDANLMATGAAGGHGRVDGLALALVFMALKALG